MANLSSAFGQISIKAKSIEAIKNLIILQREFEDKNYYQTELDSFKLNEIQLEKDIDERAFHEKNYFIYDDTFTASGRWSFESNVECFLNSLEFNTNDSEQLRKLKEKCQKEPYKIHFDINDEEGGNQVLCTAIASIYYDPNQDVKNYTYDITENYDYTVENLISLDFYEEGDIVSASYLIDNYDTYFTDKYNHIYAIFIENKEEIIKLLKSHPYPDSIYYDLDELIVEHTPLENFLIEKEYYHVINK